MLFGSPIFHPDGAAGYGAGGAAGGEGGAGDGFDFVDPNIDPELALALRVSLEEERARQNAAATAAGAEGAAPAEAAAVDDGAKSLHHCRYDADQDHVAGPADGAEAMALDEDALLQQALAMSMQVDEQGAGGAAAMDTDLDAALALSMADGVRLVVLTLSVAVYTSFFTRIASMMRVHVITGRHDGRGLSQPGALFPARGGPQRPSSGRGAQGAGKKGRGQGGVSGRLQSRVVVSYRDRGTGIM